MKNIEELTRASAESEYPNPDDESLIIDLQYAFIDGADWERKRDKWISIKDKLPPRNGNYNYSKRVLVTNGVECHIDEYNFTKNAWEFVDEFYLDITHWQPLPEPPKQKD